MGQLVFSSEEGETPIPRNGYQSLKLINFFGHSFSWHRKGAALGSKNFLLSCHIGMVSAGTPECQLLKLDDAQLFSFSKPLGFQSMSIINMFEKPANMDQYPGWSGHKANCSYLNGGSRQLNSVCFSCKVIISHKVTKVALMGNMKA